MYCDVVHRLCIGKPPRNTSHHHANGRSRRRVGRYLRSLPERHRDAIEVVSIDPYVAYRQAIRNELTGARIVVDHFHLVRGANTALDSVRRERQRDHGRRRPKGARRSGKGASWRQDLYRVRQRLPGARERLTERERRRLCAPFEREPPIAEAWALKQAFRSIYHAPDRHQAERRLDRFLAAVERAQLAAFTALADGVRLWRAELPAYLDEPTTNRYAEGVINKIKPIKRRAHGPPSFDGLRERVLLACARTGPHGATPPDRREPNFRPAV